MDRTFTLSVYGGDRASRAALEMAPDIHGSLMEGSKGTTVTASQVGKEVPTTSLGLSPWMAGPKTVARARRVARARGLSATVTTRDTTAIWLLCSRWQKIAKEGGIFA
jgi:hypothetical protein